MKVAPDIVLWVSYVTHRDGPRHVDESILWSPCEEPIEHWHIVEGEATERRCGRRPAVYYCRDQKYKPAPGEIGMAGNPAELVLVNDIRKRVKQWRTDG